MSEALALTHRTILERLLPRVPENFWEELALELDQLEHAAAHGHIVVRIDVVDGKARDFSLERKRERLQRQRRSRERW